jgi:hypothetical protein
VEVSCEHFVFHKRSGNFLASQASVIFCVVEFVFLIRELSWFFVKVLGARSKDNFPLSRFIVSVSGYIGI